MQVITMQNPSILNSVNQLYQQIQMQHPSSSNIPSYNTQRHQHHQLTHSNRIIARNNRLAQIRHERLKNVTTNLPKPKLKEPVLISNAPSLKVSNYNTSTSTTPFGRKKDSSTVDDTKPRRMYIQVFEDS
jgi:hypothetical protein